jgi:hypothetical protein
VSRVAPELPNMIELFTEEQVAGWLEEEGWAPVQPREGMEAKARRYLAEGRLTVTYVGDGVAPVTAECRGTDTVYRLGYDASKNEWRCTCEASTTFHRRCAHVAALQLVTTRRT